MCWWTDHHRWRVWEECHVYRLVYYAVSLPLNNQHSSVQLTRLFFLSILRTHKYIQPHISINIQLLLNILHHVVYMDPVGMAGFTHNSFQSLCFMTYKWRVFTSCRIWIGFSYPQDFPAYQVLHNRACFFLALLYSVASNTSFSVCLPNQRKGRKKILLATYISSLHLYICMLPWFVIFTCRYCGDWVICGHGTSSVFWKCRWLCQDCEKFIISIRFVFEHYIYTLEQY